MLNVNKRVKWFGLLGLLTCFSFFSAAQETGDSLVAIELLATANQLLQERDFRLSLEKAQAASAYFAETNNWSKYKDAQRSIFMNGYYSRDFDPIIPILKNGLEKIPLDQNETGRKVKAYLANAQMEAGDVFLAVQNYEAVLPAFIEAKDTLFLINIYGNLSAGFMQMHDYAKAVKYARNAVRLAEVGTNARSLGINLTLNAQAHYWNKELAQAEVLFDQAQAAYDREDGTFDIHRARLYLQQNKKEQALKSVDQGLVQIKKAKNQDREFLARVLKVQILIALGKKEKAIKQLEKVIASNYQLSNRRDLGKAQVDLAKAYREVGNYEKALTNFQLALNAFLPNYEATDPTKNPALNTLIPEAYFIDIFVGKGTCYLERTNSNQEEAALLLAEENFQLAINFIDKIKLGFGETASKLRLGEESFHAYEKMLQTKKQLFEQSGEERYRKAAFTIVQKANAFVLRELLNTEEAFALADIPEERVQQWKALRGETLRLGRLLERSPAGQKDGLQQLLFEEERKLANSKKQLLVDYPKFAQLQADVRVADLPDLQAAMAANSLLLKYFIGEKELHIFAVTATDFHWEIVELPADFEKTIYQYRRSISDLEFVRDSMQEAEQLFLQSAHALYQTLLAPVLATVNDGKINRLTIVGDGMINTIPFQSLLTQAATNWRDPANFLLRRYAINYAYFCKTLLATGGDAEPSTDFVSFGLEFDKATLDYLQKMAKDSISNQVILDNLRSGTLTNLPFSDDEAKDLAQLMKGKYWINENATKANFLAEATPANFIHMATHSILDEKNPNLSALVFTLQNENEDNLLRQEEIYNMEMNAELIVLSACNTAYGRGHTGEGLNSLARAFNVSGIPSVTATFWNIADEASKKLMELYYANLKAGLPKDIALQKAQLSYLQDDAVSSPAFRLPPYWAAWVNIGNPAPITQGAGRPWWLFALGGLVLAGGLFYITRS